MPGHNVGLITVFETDDSFALTLAKASLEDVGIEYVVDGDDPKYIAGIPGAFGMGAIPLGAKCSCWIQVAHEFEQEARALLQSLKKSATATDIEAESTPES